MIECIKSDFSNKEIDIIGFIYVDRQREVNYYKNKLKWNFPLFKFDNDFKEYYDLNEAIDFVVLSPDNKVIYNKFLAEEKNIDEDCKNLKQQIRKLLNKK